MIRFVLVIMLCEVMQLRLLLVLLVINNAGNLGMFVVSLHATDAFRCE